MISEARRLQYLDALGIDVWVSHAEAARMATRLAAGPSPAQGAMAASSDRYIIGPGTGQTLLLCRAQAETASRLASDIARCLDESPVWGWQEPVKESAGAVPAGMDLESAIRDRLFTRVLIFGSHAEALDEVIGSARVIHAPALAELANHAGYKRQLWSSLVSHGWSRRFA